MKKIKEIKVEPFISLDLMTEEGEHITTLDLTHEQTVALLQFGVVELLRRQIKFVNIEEENV